MKNKFFTRQVCACASQTCYAQNKGIENTNPKELKKPVPWKEPKVLSEKNVCARMGKK